MEQEQKVNELIESTHKMMEVEYPSYNRATSDQLAKMIMASTDTNGFVVDFDLAWEWVGYSRKDVAKRKLTQNFVQNEDYSVVVKPAAQIGGAGMTGSETDKEKTKNTPNSVQNQHNSGTGPFDSAELWKQNKRTRGGDKRTEKIMMTGRCFCHFAFMANTVQGMMCRDFAMEMLRGIRRLGEAIQNGEVELRRVNLDSEPVRKRLKTCNSNKALKEVMKEAGAIGREYAIVNGITNKAVTGFTKGEYARKLGKKNSQVNLRDEMSPEQLAATELVEMLSRKGIEEKKHQGNITAYHDSVVAKLSPFKEILHSCQMGKGTKLTEVRKEQKNLLKNKKTQE